MIGLPLGLLYANAAEWVIHRYVLHGMGRKKGTFWSFHWHEHHRNTRQNEHLDTCYGRSLFEKNAQAKEAWALVGAALLHLPLVPVAPWFVGGVCYSILNYYRVHRRSHVDPGWAREHLPWHYDHHMGPNQDANWCVTRPWFDWILRTREPYVGTEREALDLARAEVRRAKKAAREAEALVAAG